MLPQDEAHIPAQCADISARDWLAATAQAPPRYRALAALLREWQVPDDLVQLGLRLRAVERADVAPADVAATLGARAAATAAALTALAGSPPRPALQPVELPWRLFMLTHLNPAAGMLKIAEVLVQLRQREAAYVALDAASVTAAADAAARLGMWAVRSELLDIHARLADPFLARQARTRLDESRPLRLAFFAALEHELLTLLARHGIAARIRRRPRHVYQVMDEGPETLRAPLPWADVALVLIEDIHDCYRALGAINSRFPVTESRLRDCIGSPKENGYQAIHTCVEFTAALVEPRTAPVRIRIMTGTMDDYNQRGFLAALAGVPSPAQRPSWWQDCTRWQQAFAADSGEMFVFTPRGETIFLPPAATVLDFAVRVHSDLGVFCRGARVNNRRTPPSEQLALGDICEVLIDPHGEPIDRRLLASVQTRMARTTLRRALQRDAFGAAAGRLAFRETLMQRLAEQEIRASEIEVEQHVAALCKAHNYATVDAFYRALARREVAPDEFIRAIVGELLLPRLAIDQLPPEVLANVRRIKLALCCRPAPSRPAVAVVVHKGYELKIHAADCPRVGRSALALPWRSLEREAYVADVLYESWDRPGLLMQLTTAIYSVNDVNLRFFNADVPEPSLARIRFSFDAPDQATIDRVREALEAQPERRNLEVRAVTLIDDGVRSLAPLENPYGPHPVGRWPLFVGRDREVRQILTMLDERSSARHILVRGPKRIGKSSLLHHLSRYHLADFSAAVLLDLQSLPTSELQFPQLLSQLAGLIVKQLGPRGRLPAPAVAELTADPVGAFAEFLAAVRARREIERFVILIDEFATLAGRLGTDVRVAEFFDQWRALLSSEAVYRHVSFIVALPDLPLHQAGFATGDSPLVSRLGELGHPVRLNVLDAKMARDLITTPVQGHLVYEAADLDLLLRQTGGHPYYIHLVCSQIVNTIQVQQRRTGLQHHERQVVPRDLIHTALATVADHDDAFAHVFSDSTPATARLLRAVAATGAAATLERSDLQKCDLPGDVDALVETACAERPDLLAVNGTTLTLRIALVAQWLRRYRGGRI